jgi:hypothetical protein
VRRLMSTAIMPNYHFAPRDERPARKKRSGEQDGDIQD